MIELVDLVVWAPVGGGVYRVVDDIGEHAGLEFGARRGAEPGPFSLEVPVEAGGGSLLEPLRLITTTFRGDMRTWRGTQLEQDHGETSMVRVIGEDAVGMLAGGSAWPSPGKALAPPGTQAAEGNYRGTAAKVAADLVAGALPQLGIVYTAPPAEQLTWGSPMWSRPRFTPLLEELQRVAERGGLNVRFGLRLEHPADTTARLGLWFERPRDLSEVRVVLSPTDGSLDQVTVSERPPTITHATVGGRGEGTEQYLIEVTTPRSLADAARWGRVVRYIPGPDTFDDEPLIEAGEDALWEGRAQTVLNLTATEPLSLRGFEAFGPGDKIKVRLPGGAVVTEAISELTVADDGDRPVVTPKIGDPDAAVGDADDAADREVVAALRSLRRDVQSAAVNRKRGAI